MAAIRFLITLPFRLLAAAVILPIKVTLGLLKFSVKTTFVTTRAATRSSIISFAAGVGIGWCLTSTPAGRRFVERARDLVTGAATGPVDDEQLSALVRTELASGTRTWHLSQPTVSITGGVVTLAGEVPHAIGRADLEAGAASVRGVVGVDNQIVIATVAEVPA